MRPFRAFYAAWDWLKLVPFNGRVCVLIYWDGTPRPVEFWESGGKLHYHQPHIVVQPVHGPKR